jgi:hypothetical protein
MTKYYTYVDGECLSVDTVASEAITSAMYYGSITEEEAKEVIADAGHFGSKTNASGRALHPSDFPGVVIWTEEIE